jgi:hypothetical protein
MRTTLLGRCLERIFTLIIDTSVYANQFNSVLPIVTGVSTFRFWLFYRTFWVSSSFKEATSASSRACAVAALTSRKRRDARRCP